MVALRPTHRRQIQTKTKSYHLQILSILVQTKNTIPLAADKPGRSVTLRPHSCKRLLANAITLGVSEI